MSFDDTIKSLNAEIEKEREIHDLVQARLDTLKREVLDQLFAHRIHVEREDCDLNAIRLYRLGWRGSYTQHGNYEDWDDWEGEYRLTDPKGSVANFCVSPSHSGREVELRSVAEHLASATGLEVDVWDVESLAELNDRVLALLATTDRWGE